MRNYFAKGQWNAVCDRCGLKHKSSELREEWTGLRVCGLCFEVRHPQTLIRMPIEDVTPQWTRPEPYDNFRSTSNPLSTEDNLDNWIVTEIGVILNTEG